MITVDELVLSTGNLDELQERRAEIAAQLEDGDGLISMQIAKLHKRLRKFDRAINKARHTQA